MLHCLIFIPSNPPSLFLSRKVDSAFWTKPIVHKCFGWRFESVLREWVSEYSEALDYTWRSVVTSGLSLSQKACVYPAC